MPASYHWTILVNFLMMVRHLHQFNTCTTSSFTHSSSLMTLLYVVLSINISCYLGSIIALSHARWSMTLYAWNRKPSPAWSLSFSLVLVLLPSHYCHSIILLNHSILIKRLVYISYSLSFHLFVYLNPHAPITHIQTWFIPRYSKSMCNLQSPNVPALVFISFPPTLLHIEWANKCHVNSMLYWYTRMIQC